MKLTATRTAVPHSVSSSRPTLEGPDARGLPSSSAHPDRSARTVAGAGRLSSYRCDLDVRQQRPHRLGLVPKLDELPRSVTDPFERWATDREDKRAPNTIKRHRGSPRSFEAFVVDRDSRALAGEDALARACGVAMRKQSA